MRWIVVGVTAALTVAGAFAEDPGWPRELDLDGARVVVFQPQLDTFEGNTIGARMAVAVTPEGSSEQVFGAVWLESKVEIDRDTRTVTAYDIRVPRVRFPDEEADERISALLERELPGLELEISLDRFQASLENIEDLKAIAAELETAPPAIVVRDTPSVLVVVDGDPILEPIQDTPLSRVVNTPFLIIRDGGSGNLFLFAGRDAWYRARELGGDWTYTARVPSIVAALAPDDGSVELPELDAAANAGVNPDIVVAMVPTELIFTEGTPSYSPVGDGQLMYVPNTDSTLILDIASQQHFTVLSGRWYASTSLDGPWKYVASDELPAAFLDLPEDSDVGDVRVHIAGTQEAEDAVIDARVPQTAVVDRGVVELEVVFDGRPQFEPIPGSSMLWAVNSDRQMLAAEGRFWLVDGAVWYVSDAPTGPWEVAVDRPSDVDAIPPSNPNYNVKFAEIYGSTPEVVYVGYTPGYTHTYVHHVTVVHGTGFHHHPWHHTHFFPRHATWGFSVRFHPWWGWSTGIAFSNGRFTFGIGFSPWTTWHGGWWGPAPFHAHWRGYRRGFYSGWNRGFHSGVRAGYRAGFRAGVQVGARSGYRRGSAFQNRDPGGARVRDQAPRSPGLDRAAAARTNAPRNVSRTQANNVFADRSGTVHRRNPSGDWQQRAAGAWSPPERVGSTQRPTPGGDRQLSQRPTGASPRQPATRPGGVSRQPSARPALEREHLARQRGTQRSNNFNGRAGGAPAARRR